MTPERGRSDSVPKQLELPCSPVRTNGLSASAFAWLLTVKKNFLILKFEELRMQKTKKKKCQCVCAHVGMFDEANNGGGAAMGTTRLVEKAHCMPATGRAIVG